LRNLVVAIVGKKGSGKSTITREMIQEHPRVIVLDSMAEYGAESGCRVYMEDECVDAVVAHARRDRYRLSLRCLDVEDNLDLLRLAYECPRSLVVVEEASLYASPSSLPREMAQLIRFGRHRAIDQVYIARRPSELHRDVTANADLLVMFQTQEPRDLAYLRAYYGDGALDLVTMPEHDIRVFGDLKRAPKPILFRLAENGRRRSRRGSDAAFDDVELDEGLDDLEDGASDGRPTDRAPMDGGE
jgi:hypothetical protein